MVTSVFRLHLSLGRLGQLLAELGPHLLELQREALSLWHRQLSGKRGRVLLLVQQAMLRVILLMVKLPPRSG